MKNLLEYFMSKKSDIELKNIGDELFEPKDLIKFNDSSYEFSKFYESYNSNLMSKKDFIEATIRILNEFENVKENSFIHFNLLCYFLDNVSVGNKNKIDELISVLFGSKNELFHIDLGSFCYGCYSISEERNQVSIELDAGFKSTKSNKAFNLENTINGGDYEYLILEKKENGKYKNISVKEIKEEYGFERTLESTLDIMFSTNGVSNNSVIKEKGDKIEISGEFFDKFEIEENEKIGTVNSMFEDFVSINRKLIDLKLKINGKIIYGENEKNEFEEIKDFFVNFYDNYKGQIKECGYVFNKNEIIDIGQTTEELHYAIGNLEEEGILEKNLNKGENAYNMFVNWNNKSLSVIKGLINTIKKYKLEEENKSEETKSLIPVGVEYNKNEGFNEILKILLDSYKYRRNTILIGHAGFGKTFGCLVSCQLIGMPYYKFSCNNQTQIDELFGSIKQDEQGNIIREKGPLVKMMESGGLFVFDEFNALQSENLKALNGILDSIQGYKEGETINIQISGKDFTIKVHKDFRVCLTGNPVEFIDDYGVLSRVTNDLSRRCVVMNLNYIFKGEEFMNDLIKDYFNNLKILDGKEEIRKEIIKDIRTVIHEWQLALGIGSIELNENNRFFILNNYDCKDFTEEEAIDNVVLPVISLVFLPIKNILENVEDIKSGKGVVKLFLEKQFRLYFNFDDLDEEMIYDNIRKLVR